MVLTCFLFRECGFNFLCEKHPWMVFSFPWKAMATRHWLCVSWFCLSLTELNAFSEVQFLKHWIAPTTSPERKKASLLPCCVHTLCDLKQDVFKISRNQSIQCRKKKRQTTSGFYLPNFLSRVIFTVVYRHSVFHFMFHVTAKCSFPVTD